MPIFPTLTLPAGLLPVLRLPFALWRSVARERQTLSTLSDDRLRDLGLTREDVAEEAARPFWDLATRRW